MSKNQPAPQFDVNSIKAAQAVGTAPTEGVSVDKIRDILFGNQMQDYDRRFSDMEDLFLQKVREIESELSRSIHNVEATGKKQLETIANQLREEQSVRSDAVKELERNLREQTQAMDKRLGQLSDQLARLERDFTERLSKESQSLRDEMKRRNEDIRGMLGKNFADLNGSKTDRHLLAGLFIEVAKCLNQDTTIKAPPRTDDNQHV